MWTTDNIYLNWLVRKKHVNTKILNFENILTKLL